MKTMLFLALLTQIFLGSARADDVLMDGVHLLRVELKQVLSQIEPGSVVIVSEHHGFTPHHQNQIRVLEGLASSGHSKISVGLEFFEKPDQDSVNRYVLGMLSEEDFLQKIRWGKPDFSNYRMQALFSKAQGGMTLAINAPRELTSRVSKVGITGLTAAERLALPTDFRIGNDRYRKRFAKVMGEHVPAEAIQRYLEAQSIWDDAMAESIVQFKRLNSDQTLVIIVGDFHAAFGGGLPERIQSKYSKIQPVVFSQVSKDEQLWPEDGVARGEFIWISDQPLSR